MMKKLTMSWLMLCLVAQLAATPVDAESSGNQPWQAQWIGTDMLPPVDLAGASWIWTEEAGVDATRNAPPGNRFFRREINVTGNARLTSAVAVFSADNRFK